MEAHLHPQDDSCEAGSRRSTWLRRYSIFRAIRAKKCTTEVRLYTFVYEPPFSEQKTVYLGRKLIAEAHIRRFLIF